MSNREWMKGRRMSEEEINELRKRFKNNTNKSSMETDNNEQWNETWCDVCKSKPTKSEWSETKRWIVAASSVLGFTWLIIMLYMYNVLAYVTYSIVVIYILYIFIYAVKEVVDNIIDK
jgi:hypothetical protein